MVGICVVVGFVSYLIGRHVIGVKLAESGGAIREFDPSSLRGAADVDASSELGDTLASRAPLQPIVEIEPVESPIASQDESTVTDPMEPGGGAEEAPTAREEAPGVARGPQGPPSGGEPGAVGVSDGAPAADEAAAVPARPTKPTRAGVTTGGFRVRVGSYTDEEALAGQMGRLRGLGYDPWVEEYERDGVVYNRLYAARAGTYGDALGVQDALQEHNIPSQVEE